MILRNNFRCSLSVLLLAVNFSSGCQEQKPSSHQAGGAPESKPAEAVTRVTPVKPERKTLVRRTEQPGQIEAFEQTAIYAKATGFVTRFLVDIGDQVKGPQYDEQGKLVSEGQVMAELSIPELEAEITQKRALVSQAESEVKQAIAGIAVAEAALVSAKAKLVESQAGIERDQAQYDRWKSELSRITDLADKGAVTRKLQDETENQFRAADSSRRESAAKVRSADAVVAESAANIKKVQADREATESRLEVAKADEQRLRALWSYATIRAPYDGTVSTRNISTGDLVQSGVNNTGRPIFVVVRTDVVRIFVDVPEGDSVLTQTDNEVTVRIPAIAGASFKGAVTRSAWVLDAATRTLRTEIDVLNSNGRLRPGMYAYADLKVAERPDALSLPKSAILRHESQAFCLTIDSSHKVVRTPIVAGIQAGNDVEIVSGLKGDEAVIGTNVASFHEGQEVEIVEKKEEKKEEKKANK